MDGGAPQTGRYAPPPLVWAGLVVGGLAAWVVLGFMAVAPFVLAGALIAVMPDDDVPTAHERLHGFQRPSPWWRGRSPAQWERAWRRVGKVALVMLALVGLAALIGLV